MLTSLGAMQLHGTTAISLLLQAFRVFGYQPSPEHSSAIVSRLSLASGLDWTQARDEYAELLTKHAIHKKCNIVCVMEDENSTDIKVASCKRKRVTETGRCGWHVGTCDTAQ